MPALLLHADLCSVRSAQSAAQLSLHISSILCKLSRMERAAVLPARGGEVPEPTTVVGMTAACCVVGQACGRFGQYHRGRTRQLLVCRFLALVPIGTDQLAKAATALWEQVTAQGVQMSLV
jgi:hypothetical protein